MKVFIALFFGISIITYGQRNDTVDYRKQAHKLAVKWSAAHLLDFYPTLQVAVEHRIFNRCALQWEGGYVVNTASEEEKSGFDKRGFKLSVDLRKYFPIGVSGRHAFFAAPEFYYNR